MARFVSMLFTKYKKKRRKTRIIDHYNISVCSRMSAVEMVLICQYLMRLGTWCQTFWSIHLFPHKWPLLFEALVVWWVLSQAPAGQRLIRLHHFLAFTPALKWRTQLKKEIENYIRSKDCNCNSNKSYHFEQFTKDYFLKRTILYRW